MQCLFASPSPAVVVVPQYNNSVNIFRSIHSSTFPGICPPHPWVEECHTHTFRTLGLLKFCCCLLADRCPPTNEPTLFSHQLSTHCYTLSRHHLESLSLYSFYWWQYFLFWLLWFRAECGTSSLLLLLASLISQHICHLLTDWTSSISRKNCCQRLLPSKLINSQRSQRLELCHCTSSSSSLYSQVRVSLFVVHQHSRTWFIREETFHSLLRCGPRRGWWTDAGEINYYCRRSFVVAIILWEPMMNTGRHCVVSPRGSQLMAHSIWSRIGDVLISGLESPILLSGSS